MGEEIHVVGPVQGPSHWLLLCPICDDDRVEGLGDRTPVCTTVWLRGRLLTGDARLQHRTCLCFETDPLEGVPDATPKQRRFFLYSTIARELGAVGLRAELPGCVRDQIEELHGESTVGFVDRSA